ncbi:MAG: hypothetical protein EOO90_25035 [Pedobacter sp.]|nr:MAG: hypothetical protein EOO90_25035 [Pedobacter sp.]
MTALTLMPCQDREDSSAHISLPNFQKASKANDHPQKETCTPFCTCSCCSVSRDFIQPRTFFSIIEISPSQYSRYRTPALAEQFIEIYQPPQIV